MIASVLLLGGTGDALSIARHCGPALIYSVAGLGVTPTDLQCRVRVGGFGGSDGLASFIRRESIQLLIDATHPYADRISTNAALAAVDAGIPRWHLRRPAWTQQPDDDWRELPDWPAIARAVTRFHRPLFTLGRAPLEYLSSIPEHQHWVVRCLEVSAAQIATPGPRATLVAARGPFTLENERALFDRHSIDVLISKQSGGTATSAKLQVARERGVPVLMLARSATAPQYSADRIFDSPGALVEALEPGIRSKV